MLSEMPKVIKVPKWVLPFGYGFTLYKLVFIREDSKDYEYVKQHELVHVEQWTRIGFFKFPYLYIKELIKNGYINNIYEIEARELGAKRSKNINVKDFL